MAETEAGWLATAALPANKVALTEKASHKISSASPAQPNILSALQFETVNVVWTWSSFTVPIDSYVSFGKDTERWGKIREAANLSLASVRERLQAAFIGAGVAPMICHPLPATK